MENNIYDGEIGVNNGTWQPAPQDSVEPNTEYRRGQEMLSTLDDLSESAANGLDKACESEEKTEELTMTIGDQIVLRPDFCFDGGTLPFGWECSDYSIVGINPTQSLSQAQIQAMSVGEAKVTATSVYPELCKGSVTWNVTVKGVHETPEAPKKDNEVLIEEFTDALKSGGDVTLEDDIQITTKLALAKPANVDLSGNTITNQTPGGDAIQLGAGEFTIKNGVIDNTIGGGASAGIYLNSSKGTTLTVEDLDVTAAYPLYLNNATIPPVVTIKSGVYTSPFDKGVAVYVEKGGKAIIEGGVFTSNGHPTDFLLNLKDTIRKPTTDKDPVEFIEVRGGKFYNFNPEDNKSEGEGTDYVAPGYIVGSYTKGDDTIYVVEKYTEQPDVDIDGPEGTPVTWNISKAKARLGITEIDADKEEKKEEEEEQKPDFEF